MSNHHVLFQTVTMAKNDAEYNLAILDKLIKKLDRKLTNLENELQEFPFEME
jgi:prefoldin subunit 5